MNELITIYTLLQICCFFSYGIDKLKAQKNQYRLPEKLLLTLSIFGPWGAYLAMRIFHHKTRKVYFYLITIGAMVVHVVIYFVFIK